MALKTDIRGMVHVYPDYFVVGREKIREYGHAVKAEDPATFDEKPAAELGHPEVVAPLTFTSVFALLVQQDFFRNVDVGIETMNIVQVDQRFIYHRRSRRTRPRSLHHFDGPAGRGDGGDRRTVVSRRLTVRVTSGAMVRPSPGGDGRRARRNAEMAKMTKLRTGRFILSACSR